MSRARVRCNECDHKANVTTTKVISKLVTHLYCQCTNVHCGHTFRLSQSFDHTICPPVGTNEQLLLSLIQSLAPEKKLDILDQLS